MHIKRGDQILNLRIRRWLYFVVFFALTLFLCWQNPTESSSMTSGVCQLVQSLLASIGISVEYTEVFYLIIRKTGHALVFAILAIYGYFAFSATIIDWRKSTLLAVVTCVVTAIFTESTQQFFSGRETHFFDACINLLGVFVGILLAIAIQSLKSKIQHRHKLKTA